MFIVHRFGFIANNFQRFRNEKIKKGHWKEKNFSFGFGLNSYSLLLKLRNLN